MARPSTAVPDRHAASALAALAERYWRFVCEEAPMEAILAGAPTGEQLLREAPADHERRAAWAREPLAELARIDVASLGVQDRATHALLERELRALLSTVAVKAHLRPSLYPLGPEFMLGYWASFTSLATPEETKNYLARLATIPAALDGVREALAEGARQGVRYPALVLERAVAQIRGQVTAAAEASPFYQPLARLAGRPAFAAMAAEGLALVDGRVHPAFLAYADFIETALGPLARESLGCTLDVEGEAFYRHLIRQFATVDLEPAEIHAIGLAEVDRIGEAMRIVAAEAGFPDALEGFRRHLQADGSQIAASADALREQIEVLSKRIDARIPEFFGRVPRTTYGVRSIPVAIAEKMPPAYAQPNPADGSAAGVHWITSIPAKCPRYMHLPLALHEAWPGHLMHFALIQEMDGLPRFRRHGGLRYSAYLEGWALYSEALGQEMGFYDSPEKRYGRLEMEMWRAVRLVTDTGIHAFGWSRARAIDYFKTHMAMPSSTVEAEVDRHVGLPGQALGYQLGNLAFRRIRERAEAALGDGFRLRDFHDALMAAGPVTLPVLDALMADWIAQRTPVPRGSGARRSGRSRSG